MPIKDVIQTFAQQQTADAEAMSAYMRNQFPFLGLKSKERKQLSRPYLQAWKQRQEIEWTLVEELWEQAEREYQYLACDYIQSMRKYLQIEDLKHLAKYISWKSWWDTVDALVKEVGYLQHRFPELKNEILAWSLSDNLWLRRTSIINQLGLKQETDTALLRATIENNIGSTEFFINKAIGWALREYSKTNPAWVAAFLKLHRDKWAPLTWREATKYLDISK